MMNSPGSSVQASDIAAATTSMQATDTAAPITQECDVTAPSILQHVLPGPSGTQVQPEYGNVSIFTSTFYLVIQKISTYFFQLF
jgi:hypothetical protein